MGRSLTASQKHNDIENMGKKRDPKITSPLSSRTEPDEASHNFAAQPWPGARCHGDAMMERVQG